MRPMRQGFMFRNHVARSPKIEPVDIAVPSRLIEVYGFTRLVGHRSGVVELHGTAGGVTRVLACGLQPSLENLPKFLRPWTTRPGLDVDDKWDDFGF